MPNQPANQPRSGWIRFTLRTFLVLILVLGVGCGWLGSVLRRQHEQQRTIRRLESHGHSAMYDFQLTKGDEEPRPPGPQLLRRFFGDDLFAHITLVDLGNVPTEDDLYALRQLPRLKSVTCLKHPVDDEAAIAGLAQVPKLEVLHLKTTGDILAPLRGAPRLETLVLEGPMLRNEDLWPLSKLPRLRELSLSHTSVGLNGLEHVGRITELKSLKIYDAKIVDDDALAPISQLAKLERLTLSGTKVSDGGLRHLRALTALKSLTLINIHLTDAGLAHLADLANLRELTYSGGDVGNAGLRFLAKLQDLEYLNLYHAQVSDEGLQSIAQLHQLRKLFISGSVVTDEGLLQLKSLRYLDSLFVGSNVSAQGVARLHAYLPSCQIEGLSIVAGEECSLP